MSRPAPIEPMELMPDAPGGGVSPWLARLAPHRHRLAAAAGLVLFALVHFLGLGTLAGGTGFSFVNCLYFSAETYTSLGFGDLLPVGPIRPLAGTEALNGLLLIGWTASYTYIAMERFWSQRDDLL